MNVSVFSTATTDVFPAVNTHTGGQLLTEYNLRSRESVETPSKIKYFVGPSFCHSRDDFYVGPARDGAGVITSSMILELGEGRAIVNGHYVYSHVPIHIDLVQLNELARKRGDNEHLEGAISVGLRAMYATDQTIAGSILTEHSIKTTGEIDKTGDMFEGIQVVILPADKLITPMDSPEDQNAVTAHIKLATFQYINGAIQFDTLDDNYPERCAWISADRISNLGDGIGDVYVRKTGLDHKKLYVFSGKGTDPKDTTKDTWCAAEDSLFVWDSNPELTTKKIPIADRKCKFYLDSDGKTKLLLAHKQVDDYVKDEGGQQQYYKNRQLALPLANFNTLSGGTVDAGFIKSIQHITSQMRALYALPNGKQRAYLPYLDTREIDTDPDDDTTVGLPKLLKEWNVGDYVLVGIDHTAGTESGQDPSTFYVVLPGPILELKKEPADGRPKEGRQLLVDVYACETMDEFKSLSQDASSWAITRYGVQDAGFNGAPGDYITLTVTYTAESESGDGSASSVQLATNNYVVTKEDETGRQYCDPPLRLTGNIQLATEETIGGFYNVAESRIDEGFVYLDGEGHLRLRDYELLRSGTLAYQLGENVIISSDHQEQLNDYVNERVAFPFYEQTIAAIADEEDPQEIRVTLDFSGSDSAETINVYSIDSRFNTDVNLKITGDGSNITLNISDCQKVRLTIDTENPPKINVYRSGLYYDPETLDKISACYDISIWYRKFKESDPDLMVDGMTVIDCATDPITSQIDYWTDTVVNDNHYLYCLQSVTITPNGEVGGIGIYVKNDSTYNVASGKWLIGSKFQVSPSAGLDYPRSWMKHDVRCDGSFNTAYPNSSPPGYVLSKTTVQAVLKQYSIGDTAPQGSITFFTESDVIGTSYVIGIEDSVTPDSLETNTFHVIKGWVTNWN